MTRRLLALFWTSLSIATSSCGREGTSPAAPSPAAADRPTPGQPSTVSLRKLHSELGDLGAGFTRTLTGAESFSIRLSDLEVPAADPSRAVMVELGPNGEIGPYVTSTRDGVLQVLNPGRDVVYGIVLMSTLNRTDYACLDYCPTCYGTKAFRVATMRMALEGEDVHGYRARAASDRPFRHAANLMTEALNVGGLHLGGVELVSSPRADLVGAWADIPASGYGYRDAAVVNFRFGDPTAEECRPYSCLNGLTPLEHNLRYAAYLALHEFGHTYLSAPDYDARPGCAAGGNLLCMLIACPPDDGYPVLSPAGRDAIRYWALMNHRP